MSDQIRRFEDKPLYHSDELLHLFGCGYEHFRKKIVGKEPGQLRAVTVGKKGFLVTRDALLDFMKDKELNQHGKQ